MNKTVRTRDDGILESVFGPLSPCEHDRDSIASRMGWKAEDKEALISKTLNLLREGKAVRLKSHLGYCVFQPLAPDEDGRNIPASGSVVYNHDGKVVERKLS